MKNILAASLFLFMICVQAQLPPGYFTKNGEVYFRFSYTDKTTINQLSKIISIDNVTSDSVYAYANESEFNNFLKSGIHYQVLPHPGDADDVRMSDNIDDIKAWDYYPTYDAYVAMMQQFETQYPSLCKLYEIGTSVQGRKLLFVKISDNVESRESEPDFMFSSSIHGDETTGYVLMLRLIDYLLTNYNTNSRITNLINNVEIWINPLANPDGTYRSGNSTVSGARRYNANNIDLNRNFPDPADGPHPDGNSWQPETIAMARFFHERRFILSANFHGGAEVLNYPWDTWQRRHPDDAWWQFICRQYADTVHANAPSTYLRFLNNGITNGYDWYRVAGGRQDYMTYFARGREVTIEISNTKLLPASLLPAHWEYNYRSFIKYIEQTLTGIQGVVTDIYNRPLKAKIFVNGRDADNSDVFTDSLTGDYHRMLNAGTYSITVSADSHFAETINNIVVVNGQPTFVNVALQPVNPIPVELTSFTATVIDNNIILRWKTTSEKNNKGFRLMTKSGNEADFSLLVFIPGRGTSTESHNYTYTMFNPGPGEYYFRLVQEDLDGALSEHQILRVVVSAPREFGLSKNFPNPFNPVTSFSYTLPHQEHVLLEVYDLIGNKIATLVNEIKPAGTYPVHFDASAFHSGVYFAKIKAGNFTALQKMILVK